MVLEKGFNEHYDRRRWKDYILLPLCLIPLQVCLDTGSTRFLLTGQYPTHELTTSIRFNEMVGHIYEQGNYCEELGATHVKKSFG